MSRRCMTRAAEKNAHKFFNFFFYNQDIATDKVL